MKWKQVNEVLCIHHTKWIMASNMCIVIDTTLSESVGTGSDIVMKLQQGCDSSCNDYDIVVVIPSGVFEDSRK